MGKKGNQTDDEAEAESDISLNFERVLDRRLGGSMVFDYTKEPGRVKFDREYVTEGEPLISVVTPYYNAHEYFEYLYPCVVNQTFPWFEWIVVNDGSTHECSKNQLALLEAKDERIKVIHKENGGISSARNRGIQESKAEIVITLDADELIEPTYFEVLYWALYFNPEYSWAYTDSVGFDGQEYLWDPSFSAERLKYSNYLTESAAIRKKDLIEVGCYDEVEKHYYEDWRLWLKLLSKSKKPIHVSGIEFWYRRIDSGVLNKIKQDRKLRKKANQLITKAASTVDTSVKAKEFYNLWCAEDIQKARKTQMSRAYRKNKKKNHALLVVDHLEDDAVKQLFHQACDKDRELTIVLTGSVPCGCMQKLRGYTQDVFCVADFLDSEHYAEFISYVIESRQVDTCEILGSYYGHWLVPWIQKLYPELELINHIDREDSSEEVSEMIYGEMRDSIRDTDHRSNKGLLNKNNLKKVFLNIYQFGLWKTVKKILLK